MMREILWCFLSIYLFLNTFTMIGDINVWLNPEKHKKIDVSKLRKKFSYLIGKTTLNP